MTTEKCIHPVIQRHPSDHLEYQCQNCLERAYVRIDADDFHEYEIDDAIRIAQLWRAGKLIGADQDGVRDALLAEIERLRGAQQPTSVSIDWICGCGHATKAEHEAAYPKRGHT